MARCLSFVLVLFVTLLTLVTGAGAADVPALVAALTERFDALEAKPMAQQDLSDYVWLTLDIDTARADVDDLLAEEPTTRAVAAAARERLGMLEKQVDAATERVSRYQWIVSRGWPEPIMEAVIARRIAIGMTTAHVLAAWENPSAINGTETPEGWREEWVYPNALVYFRGERVTAIQRPRSLTRHN